MAPLDEPDLSAELAVVSDFRAAHADAMTLVADGVRQLATQLSTREPEVGQRLKREETILDKLVRQPTMALSRMHDIAGCRAILADQAEADALAEALDGQPGWQLGPRVWDYVAEPKPDGYRAKHLVAVVGSLQVEIQVRTVPQHLWAELVEGLDRDFGLRNKFGEGDQALADALRGASDALAAYERGELDLTATMGALILAMTLARLER